MFPKLTTKHLAAQVKMESDGHSFTAVISSDSLDRQQEVLLPDGCDVSEFMKTGTLFWNHCYDMPIGKATSVKRRGNELVSEARFATRPDDYEGDFFPDYVAALVRQGVVKGVSVGFAPVETRMPTQKDLSRYGQDVRRVISKWKLYEWSVAPLQANVDAVIESVGKGLLSRSMTLKHFADNQDVITALNAPPARKRIVFDLGGNGNADTDIEVRRAVAKARGAMYLD
jgi:HK97 family phage prohead protease